MALRFTVVAVVEQIASVAARFGHKVEYRISIKHLNFKMTGFSKGVLGNL